MSNIDVWNYRVARWHDDNGETYYNIVECYYDSDGNITAWHLVRSLDADSVEELEADLHLIMNAILTKTVIEGDLLPK